MVKIAVIGVESTGKSLLSKQLAAYFDAPLLTEYAREYLLLNGNEYDYADFLEIAQGQALQEKKASIEFSNKKMLILDTDFIVIKLWSEIAFNHTEKWIDEYLLSNLADLYLICTPNIPWVQDGLREYPILQDRIDINQLYINTLHQYNCNFNLINDSDFSLRFQQAKNAIKEFFKLNSQALNSK